MHFGSKGWYVKELRNMGVKVHPIYRDHLSKHKGSELARIYNQVKLKDEIIKKACEVMKEAMQQKEVQE